MEELVQHLRGLIRINRQILNKLNKDEASLEYLRKAFDKREVHTQKMNAIVSEINQENLTEEESNTLTPLFERFARQSDKIHQALDYIVQETRDKLGDAIKRRKAEEGYKVLK